jgi:salicylate hydroxylase
MQSMDIAIIGAGIGGLTAALALSRAGQRVTVYERTAALGEVGAGLTVTPNASHVLHMLGLGDWIRTMADCPDEGVVRNWASGEIIAWNTRRADVERECGAEYFQVHRADLHGEMVARLERTSPGCLRLGHAFTGCEQRDGRVMLRFDSGATAVADVVVGADGVRSSVRPALFGADQPQFTGYVAWRGLVPRASLPADVVDYPSSLYLGPGYLFLRYLVRQGQLVNFVCIGRAPGWTEEGWAVPATPGELLGLLTGWNGRVRDIVEHVPADRFFKWGLFDRPPLPQWTVGRVTLLGDAAHPMLPFLGQGAVMAMEDAGIIGRAFAESATPEEALRRYEAARLTRANHVMTTSRETGVRLISREPEAYTQKTHVSAGTLGFMAYNPRTVAI